MACGLCFTVASGVVLFVLCVRALHVLKSTRAYVCLVLQILCLEAAGFSSSMFI